jgi:hypothetical protein
MLAVLVVAALAQIKKRRTGELCGETPKNDLARGEIFALWL